MPMLMVRDKSFRTRVFIWEMNCGVDAFADGEGEAGGCVWEEDDKFVSAVACGDVHDAQIPGDNFGGDLKDAVTKLVAHGVIEFFVAVEIAHDAGEVFSVAGAFGEVSFEDLAEMASVVEAGEWVGGSHLFEFLEAVLELLILDGNFAGGLLLLLVEQFIFLLDLPGLEIFFNDERDGEEVVAGLEDVVVGTGEDGLGGGLADVFAGDDDDGAIDFEQNCLEEIEA